MKVKLSISRAQALEILDVLKREHSRYYGRPYGARLSHEGQPCGLSLETQPWVEYDSPQDFGLGLADMEIVGQEYQSGLRSFEWRSSNDNVLRVSLEAGQPVAVLNGRRHGLAHWAMDHYFPWLKDSYVLEFESRAVEPWYMAGVTPLTHPLAEGIDTDY